MHGAESAPPLPEPELQELAAAFPQLVIEEMIGRGGMGRVYRARQPHLSRIVALKVLSAERAGDPEWLERFNREARALARLSHPHIVQVYDFGEKPMPYLLMEHVEGVNLRQAMQHGGLTAREALTIVPTLCDALHYAHEHDVLHRDIKPENILIDTDGRVKLVDFGLAKLRDESALPFTLTQSGAKLGTLAYMAPEQVEKPAEVDHRADIYSLGVVLYEMLTGELPLGRFPAPSEASGVDARLDGVVMRTLEKQKDKRFQTAEQMKSGLEDAARGRTPRPPHSQHQKWVRYLLAAIVLLLAAPAVLIIFGLLSHKPAPKPVVDKNQQARAEWQRRQEADRSMRDKSNEWVARASKAGSKAAQESVLKEIREALKSTDEATLRAALAATQGLHQLDFDRAPFRELARQNLASESPEVRIGAMGALMTCNPDASDGPRLLKLMHACTDEEIGSILFGIRTVAEGDFTGEYAGPVLSLLERGMAAAQRDQGNNPGIDSRRILGVVWGSKVSPEIEARLIEWSHLGEDKNGNFSASNSNLGYNTFYHALSVQSNKSRAAVKRILELAHHPDTTNIAGRCLWGLNGTVPDKADQAHAATEVIKLLGLRSDDYLWKKGLLLLQNWSGAEHLTALGALAASETLPQSRKEALNQIIRTVRAAP
ncbi:MAG: serine/threonine protein kinase [Prosthecobacter sp.]|nr:serine/threonine protein kinase [Prosthecobacter sp.]